MLQRSARRLIAAHVRRRWARAAAIGVVAVILAAAIAGGWALHRRNAAATAETKAATSAASAAAAHSIAVLPFENLGDSADAYFADGITDAVRGKLTDIPGLDGDRARELERVPRHEHDARLDRPPARRALFTDGHRALCRYRWLRGVCK